MEDIAYIVTDNFRVKNLWNGRSELLSEFLQDSNYDFYTEKEYRRAYGEEDSMLITDISVCKKLCEKTGFFENDKNNDHITNPYTVINHTLYNGVGEKCSISALYGSEGTPVNNFKKAEYKVNYTVRDRQNPDFAFHNEFDVALPESFKEGYYVRSFIEDKVNEKMKEHADLFKPFMLYMDIDYTYREIKDIE